MDEYITVKEFAAAANVTTQRIYQLLAKDLQPFTKSIDGKKMLSIDGLALFRNQDLQSNSSALAENLPNHFASKSDLPNYFARIKELTEELEQKNSEISALNETLAKRLQDLQNSEKAITKLETECKSLNVLIEELKADKAKLNERLDREQETISDLSAALKAAQVLHGMDKQQQAIEVKEQAQPEQGAPEPAPEPDKKPSLFARIFKRS